MPTPDVYEAEYQFWPWGKLLRAVAAWVREHAPKNGHVVDYMCGTAFLLNEIAKVRPDLNLAGCSITPDYIEYARERYPSLDVECCDVFDYHPRWQPDMVLCTGGLHHLPRDAQPCFLDKVVAELSTGGHLLLGEEVIRHTQTEMDRKTAVVDLIEAILRYAIRHEAPDAVLSAVIDLLGNDLFERGEYKASHIQLLGVLQDRFTAVNFEKIWPPDQTDFGDIVYICSVGRVR